MSAYVYKCSSCGAREVKLWRQYNTLADYLDLLCLACAEKDQGKKLGRDSDSVAGTSTVTPSACPSSGTASKGS